MAMPARPIAKLETWWDSNFTPKNSKWLQGNVSETEKKVKAMVKILELDAESFAQRANMYYKRQPELISLAKEFYRAYRALAERYDMAAGALRVATRSLAEAYPNQTPPSLSLPDEPHNTPLSEPRTPEMPSPARSLFDPDELHKDIGSSPNGKKNNSDGSKQVNDLFQGEPRARKGLSFDAEKAQKDIATLQKDIIHLTEETKQLKDQVLSEAERANKAEGELLTLKGNFLHSSFEKDAACIECESHSERLRNVESELAQAHSDLIRLTEVEKLSQEQKLEEELLEKKVELQVMEVEQLTEKLQDVEKSKLESVREVEKLTEQTVSSEMTIRKLQGKIGVLEGTIEKLKKEIQAFQEKVHEMESNLSDSEEENKCLKEKLQELDATVSDLQIEIEMLKNERLKLAGEVQTLKESVIELKSEKEDVQRDLNQLKLEVAIEADMLRNAEKLNLTQQSELELLQGRLKSQEQLHHKLVKEIGELNKEKITSEETINELSKDLTTLLQTKERLEKEAVVHLREKETLQRDLSHQIQDTCDLANKHQILTAQTEAAIRVNAVLKEAFTKYEVERGILSEKNVVLEKELSDNVAELKMLREKVRELEVSRATLTDQMSVHISEKADLASYFSEIYVKNSALESSLFEMSEKLKASEESCQSLIGLKSGLVAERNDLLSQFQRYHKELGGKTFTIIWRERLLMQNHLQELEQLLSSRTEEHEKALSSHENQILMHLSEKDNLASKIECLSQTIDEISRKNSELESSLVQVNTDIDQLKEKLNESEESCRSLIAQKSTLVAEKGDLLSQVERMAAVIKSLEEKHRGLEENNSALSKERHFKQNQVNKLQELLGCKIVEHELHITSFQDQIEYLTEKNSSQLSKIEHLTKELKDSEMAHQLLNDEKQDLVAEKDDLFSQVEKITVAMKNLEEKHLAVSDERDLLQNDLKGLELLLSSKTEEYENAVQSRDLHVNALGDQILTHVTEKTALATQIETLNHTINDLQSRNNEFESSLSTANAQLEHLINQKSALDAEIEVLKDKLKESEDSCWSVIEQKSALIAEKDDLSSQVESIKVAMKDLEEEHSNLEMNYTSLSKERDLMQKNVQELELLLDSKVEEHASAIKSHEMHRVNLETQISEHISEKTALESQIISLDHTIEAISSENCELERSLLDANAQVKDLTKKLQECENSCYSLTTEKSVLISEKSDLLSQVDSLTAGIKNFEDRHALLEQNYRSLSKQRDTTESQLKELQELLNFKTEEHNSALQMHDLHVTSLQNQITTHLSQIETLQNSISEISQKNAFLEGSVSDLNAEIISVNMTLKESQKLCQSLRAQRSALVSQKDELSAQVHSMKGFLNKLEAKHEDLEENFSKVSDQRDVALSRVNELCNALIIKQQEHSMVLKSHELHVADLQDQIAEHISENSSLLFQITVLLSTIYEISERNSTLATSLSDVSAEKDNLFSQVENLTHVIQKLEMKILTLSNERDVMQNQLQESHDLLNLKTQEHGNQIHELQERNQLTKENLEKELLKNSSASNHLFILERSLSDMVDQHLQVSQLTEQVISRLEEEERENRTLREQNKRLREGIYEFTNALGIRNEDDLIEEVLLQGLLCEIQNVMKLKEDSEDMNICMDLELSVLTTILCQMGLDVTGLKLVKGVLKKELEIKENELRDLHRNLMHEVQIGKQREDTFKREIKDLNASLCVSKSEISTLREKNEAITKELELSLSECLMLQHLYSFFDSLSTERGSLLKSLSDEITSLNADNIKQNKKLGILEGENESLKRSLSFLEGEFRANLIISEFDLNHSRKICEELSTEKSGLEVEISSLTKEKERMQSEVFELRSEFEKCQRHVALLVSEVIAVTVSSAVYKEEVTELMMENEGLEIKALAQNGALMDDISQRNTFIEGLNTRLVEMECENKRLKAGLDAYLPLVESLKDCVSSLELHTLSLSRRLQASQLKKVESIKVAMKDLEEEHSNLEMNYASLSKERDLMQKNVQELELLLDSKVEEHASAIKSHEMHRVNLETQISEHISEKTALESQIISLDHTIEAISSENCELERSLLDANAQVKDLTKKLQECENSCYSLTTEKSVLISEKSDLLSQVDSLTAGIKNFEDRHALLEQNYRSLSKQRDTTESQLKELQELLNFKTEEHNSALQMHDLHVTSLQNQITTHWSQIETLQNSISEISQKNAFLEGSVSDLNAEIISVNMTLKESQKLCQLEGSIDGLDEGSGTTKCRSLNQKIWLWIGRIFRFFGAIKYHLVKYIRAVLCFCHSFFAAHFLSKQGTSEICSSHSNSKNDPSNINDGIDFKPRGTEQEVSSKKEEIFKKLAELRQQDKLKKRAEPNETTLSYI